MKKALILIFLISIPVSASALVMWSLDEPYEGKGIPDNTVIDIITHKGAVWMATGHGLSYLYFGDNIWYKYDSTNGLVSQDVSAIYSDSINEVLWVATNRIDSVGVYGDGLSFTQNEGMDWDTMMVNGTVGYDYIVFDITGLDSLIFCASKKGGLLGSFDYGQSWRNIYASRNDSISHNSDLPEFPLSNRYFSAVLDTLHQDSLILWAGTAAGLMRYVYAPAYAKPSSDYILDIASADGYVFICGDRGLTRLKFVDVGVSTYFEEYHSSFVDDGLPGIAVTTAYGFGERLFVGTLDSLGREYVVDTIANSDTTFDTTDVIYIRYGEGAGFAISDDNGLTFHTNFSGLDSLSGENRYPEEFASIEYHLFMAAHEAGLYMSSDTGGTWQKVYVDTLDTTLANGRNIVHSVAADSLNLWVGTDSGLVLLYFDSLGTIDSLKNFVFEDSDTSGARSYQTGIQKYTDTLGNVDSAAVWTVNHPIDTAVGTYSVYYSMDYGTTWNTAPGYLTTDFPYYDIGFINNIIYLVGEDKFTLSLERIYWLPYPAELIKDSVDIILNFRKEDINCFAAVNDTIYIGAESGFAISPPRPSDARWHIVTANYDPTRHDKVSNYRYPHLSGNFVNVLGVQYLPEGQSRIWASTRWADSLQRDGISSSTLDGLNWEIMHTDVQSWNFAFNGPHVFAATSSGLLHSPDTGLTWDTLTISGIQVSSDPPVDYRISPGTQVIAVEVIGDTLWVGTDDGAAKISLADLGQPGWEIYRVYDASPIVYAYAYPVPFSHAEDDAVTFHYPVPEGANVSIEVFDFTMDLVRTVIDYQFRGEGIYTSDRWDGLNGRGEPVAIGMYYFKISLSTGENYWGKLAIVP